MACPSCGARLLAKTSDRPPRLICAGCGRVLPQTNLPPLLGLIDRHGLGLLALLLLLALPLVLVALSPWLEQAPHRGGYRREESHRSHDAHRKAVKPSRWDPRTGVVGRQR